MDNFEHYYSSRINKLVMPGVEFSHGAVQARREREAQWTRGGRVGPEG